MSLDFRQRTALAFGMAMVVVMPSSPRAVVRAQAARAIGTQVVIKPGGSLKVRDNVVDSGKSHRIYTIERSEGEWRWLVSGAVAGWARASDVIPLSEAIDFYTAEIKANPHSASAYFLRAMIEKDHGRIDEAFSDYSAAIRQDPKFVPALINRGNLWLAKKSHDRAITDFSDAILADPTSVLAHVNRGIVYQTKGDYDKALADYDDAIRLGLKTAPGFNNRGHAREMKKDYDGAIADYTEAIELDSGYTLAWTNRGSARAAKGDYPSALADFTESTKLNPKSPWGYALRAWILATCPDEQYRDSKEAVTLASQAVELEPGRDARLLDIRAAAYAAAGEFAKAIYDESQAVALVVKKAPVDAEVYRGRLKLYKANTPFRDSKPEPKTGS